jgi:hopene-associated glycosyltransferase HpnB
MFTVALIAGFVCVVVWLYLLLGHGRFWRIPLPDPVLANSGPERGTPKITVSPPSVILSGVGASQPESKDPYTHENVSVAAVIPARNEAGVIGRSVSSLLLQSRPTLSPESGEEGGAPGFHSDCLHIFIVDDNSTDGTADAARVAAEQYPNRVTVVTGRPLPSGWSGKLWAVQQGIEQALALRPDYILLTDADIEHSSDNVGSLIAIAESGGYDIASYMVKLHCRSLAEKLLIPAFVFFFFLLYPPEWIRDPRRKTAGAAGGCILIRPSALERIGGIAAIRSEIIDDCALARAVKQTGGQVWLGASADTHSVRHYESFAEIEKMIARTAFNQLRHSFWLLAGTVLGMLLIYILPLALLASGSAKPAIAGAVAFGLMCALYLPMVRFYGLSPLWALTLPFSAAFYAAATVHSAVKYWSGRGGEWKGRAQDA